MRNSSAGIQSFSCGLLALTTMTGAASGQTRDGFNVAQAEAVADLLESVARGEARFDLIADVMALEGTSLIVGQLNLARQVSREQYRQMLTAFVERLEPSIEPLDDGVRARRGVDGLHDAWRRLEWALDHIPLVRRRTREMADMRITGDVRNTVMAALPEPVELTPALFAVAGGRAGAAALGDSSIYFDVVVMSIAAENNPEERTFDEELISRFVSHEFHHLALGRLHRRLGVNTTRAADRRAWRVLASLIEEGSATYFIDWDGDFPGHRNDAAFVEYLDELSSWYATVERILSSVTSGEVAGDEEFADITSVMLGNSYHAVGAAMFATIDRALGRDAALAVVGDPRNLLRAFNDASQSYRFPERLATTVARLGLEQ